MKNAILVVLSFTGLISFGQDINQMTYEAYLSSSETLWLGAVEQASRKYENTKDDASLFELALAQFGVLNYTMIDQKKDLFNRFADDTLEKLDDLQERDYRSADVQALKASIYGNSIAYSPWKSMYLGPRSASLVEAAIKADPKSPIVQKQYAQQKYFTPETWGGNKEIARDSFEKSIELFEMESATNNWMYLDNHAWLGIIHREQDNKEGALAVWGKAIEAEPDFHWVSKQLIPSVRE